MSPRLRRATGRAAQGLLLPLSLVPVLAVAPIIASAHRNFDRRHKSGPVEPPAVTWSAWEDARYHPLPAHPDAVPVLAYHGINDAPDGYSVSQATFTKQLALLRRLGFRSLSIAQYVRFLRGDRRGLPDRPLLITFDDGRLDSYRGADFALRRYGYRATMFVVAGAVLPDDRHFLSWKELRRMEDSGRWDLQEHAGDGHRRVAYDAAGRTGPFYAFRRYTKSSGLETLAQWEQRVTTDVFAGRAALAARLKRFHAWTFAVPYSNYGQRATNDPRIPALMRAFLRRQYEAVFVQDERNNPGYTTRASHRRDVERFEVHTDTSVDDLFRWLRDRAPRTGAGPHVPTDHERGTGRRG